MGAKFTFALKGATRDLIHISDMIGRDNDRLLCQDCLADLIAVIDVNKIAPHFRHKSNTLGCTASYETALHQAAKAILLKHTSVFIPGRDFVEYENPIAEQGCDRFRPDVTIQTGIGKVYVEVVVSNHPSEKKKLYYGTRNALCLVIDLSEVDRSIDLQTLKEIVLTDSECKWVINVSRDEGSPSTIKSADKWFAAALVAFTVLVYMWIKGQVTRKYFKSVNRRKRI